MNDQAQTEATTQVVVSTVPLAPATDHRQGVPLPKTPFHAALLFMAAKRQSNPGFTALVCYLNGEQVIEVEHLHGLRGSYPQVNLTAATNRARKDKTITSLIVATWVHSTSEYPYADEVVDEVYRQYDVLDEAGIKLVDNLRISETGVYSYYGDHKGQYCDAPTYHQKSICRLY